MPLCIHRAQQLLEVREKNLSSGRHRGPRSNVSNRARAVGYRSAPSPLSCPRQVLIRPHPPLEQSPGFLLQGVQRGPVRLYLVPRGCPGHACHSKAPALLHFLFWGRVIRVKDTPGHGDGVSQSSTPEPQLCYLSWPPQPFSNFIYLLVSGHTSLCSERTPSSVLRNYSGQGVGDQDHMWC